LRGPVAAPKLRGPTIPMKQAADLWDSDDFALRRRFDFSRGRGVSLQGLMWPRVVIKRRKPSRCHLMTVSGLTMISASRQSFQSLERQTQKRRSRGRRFGRLTVRLRTRSCWRRTRISVASDILEKNRDRKNRKTAEKMAIRVKRSISDEGDGQENRIAASSAKCKGNKAGWSFYQGQEACEPYLCLTA
jgi:hypothetical protein